MENIKLRSDMIGERTMVNVKEKFTTNGNVLIHFLESEVEGDSTPLIYIPGILGSANNFENEMNSLEPRKSISIILRGCGKSSVPLTGYSFDDHYSDLRAVIEEIELKEYYIMAYSMSVPYAIQAAIDYSDKVKGLIIGDYPARISNVPEGWAKKVIESNFVDESKQNSVVGIERELKLIDLTEQLNDIKSPVLVIR